MIFARRFQAHLDFWPTSLPARKYLADVLADVLADFLPAFLPAFPRIRHGEVRTVRGYMQTNWFEGLVRRSGSADSPGVTHGDS